MSDLVTLNGAPPTLARFRSPALTQAAKAGVQESFAVLGIRGKNWRIKFRGEETLITGADGMPMQLLPVVIVGASPHIAKQWYEAGYSEGSDAAPDCFSVNGIAPDAAAPKKQNSTCAVCPKNIFGSRITDDGKKAKACADSRRIAVVPLGDIENELFGGPMMLRLPATSLINLKRYAELLERKGAVVEMVATGLSFDFSAAFPRVEFRAMGWLNEDQAVRVVGADGHGGVCTHPTLARMMEEPVDEVRADPSQPAPETASLDAGGPAAVYAASQPQPQPQPEPQQPQPQPQPEPQQPQPGTPQPGHPEMPQPVQHPEQPQPAQTARQVPRFEMPQMQAQPAQAQPAQAQPAQAQPVPNGAVAPAPDDMMAAINELLHAPV